MSAADRLAPERHDSLEDVPEPQENPFFFGHEDATSRIVSAYATGKLHHGLILAGPRGIGKATFAFHLAHHLLSHPDPARAPSRLAAPDAGSTLWRQIANGSHPSVLTLTRPAATGGKGFKSAVTVEEIRRVGRFLSMTSHDGGYRIVIVDPADDMNANAANALLKNLEEPPARSLFILVSHAAGGLLPTIRSRCQTVRMTPLDDGALGQALGALKLEIDGEAGKDVFARAEGSVREAILLSRFGGLDVATAVDRVLQPREMDTIAANRIADAVTARDASIAFGLFNRHLLDLVSAAAAGRAQAGDLEGAARLAGFFDRASRAVVETETYNLDKRQHVVGLLKSAHEALAA